MATESNLSTGSWGPKAAVLVALAAVGAGLYFYLNRPPAPPPPVVLTPEAKAYVRHLKLSEVDMKASESYMQQSLLEITGKISNAGDRAVNQVEINCVFHDPYGQLVLRQRVAIVRARAGGLKPGETKTFRLAFDNVPASWNQALPQLVIARILFG